ncbi:MAG: hypothetical protein PHD48_09185 [Alphaproteobacteria bacterium]|nr:hypothetical protein [Alphaproteobacteria bacterium]
MVGNIAQNKMRCLVTMVAALAVVLAFCPYFQTGTPFEFAKKIVGYTVSITSFLVFIFNICLWRLLPEFLTGTPDLNGTWKGNLHYRWANPETKNDVQATVDPIFLAIKQTFLSIKICAFTEESESLSLSADLRATEIGFWLLSYTYDNTPDLKLRGRSQRHRGAAELKISKLNGIYQLGGEYWTDRWSQGDMSFVQKKNIVATNYAAAVAAFGDNKCA